MNTTSGADGWKPAEHRASLLWLIGIAAATIILWQIPYGSLVIYPLTILATWFHEMGHGVMAALLGAHFEKLDLYPDGSGVAHYDGGVILGPLGVAMVAAAGPLGPSFVGAALLLASRRAATAHFALVATGIALIAADLLVVRTLFGFIAVLVLGVSVLAVATRLPERVQIFAVQLIGASLRQYELEPRLSVFRPRGHWRDTDGFRHREIARQLFLPYWFWGATLSLISIILLVQSLRAAYGRRVKPRTTVAETTHA